MLRSIPLIATSPVIPAEKMVVLMALLVRFLALPMIGHQEETALQEVIGSFHEWLKFSLLPVPTIVTIRMRPDVKVPHSDVKIVVEKRPAREKQHRPQRRGF